jgi:hypothetical protein
MIFKWMKKWYVKMVNKPVAATPDQWVVWTNFTKMTHPLKYFIFESVPRYFRSKRIIFKNIKYNITQKYFSGYHKLELDVTRFKKPYGKNKLSKYSWMDSDVQIELFMFQILVNYVEKELGYDDLRTRISENFDEVTHADKEAFDMYEWFVNDYCDSTYEDKLYSELYKNYPDGEKINQMLFISSNVAKSPQQVEFEKEFRIVTNKVSEYNSKMRDEMTDNLIRLIKIRQSFWT